MTEATTKALERVYAAMAGRDSIIRKIAKLQTALAAAEKTVDDAVAELKAT